jgi:hypothetical protein
MKITLRKSIFLLMIALLFTPSCTFPVPAANPTAPATTPTPVISSTPTWIGDSTITPTLVISSTPTWIGDSTITPTPVISSTPTWIGDDITITPTLVGPSVIALKNANCRYGPGTAYDIADTLFAGATAPLVGRNELSTWWQIKGPTFGSLCWVSGTTVEVRGSTNGVPIGAAPPPPTLTPEPRPQKPKGCYVNDVFGKPVCTAPCPANAQPGGACKP